MFVASLTANGAALRYSSYLGGNLEDRGRGIAADSTGRLYLTGFTAGVWPTKSAYVSTYGGGGYDAFLSVVNPASSGAASLVTSSYVGGSGTDGGYGIGINAQGYAIIAGRTASSNFPTKNARQSTKGSGADAFVTQINPATSGTTALLYSTFLGGNADEEAYGVAVMNTGVAVVTGYTLSTNFPTVTPYQPTNGGGQDVFVARVNPSLSGNSSLTYSSYFGSSGDESGNGVALDGSGTIYLTGQTRSNLFPVVNAIDSSFGGGTCSGAPCYDGFVTLLNPATNQLRYSTFLGGSNEDVAFAIAVDPAGGAYSTGYTKSSDFTATTTTPNSGGSSDAFVVKISTTE